MSRQLGPSNSGQESSAAAVLARAIMPSEVQKNMKKCYPAHPSNVSASRCRGSLLCPSNSRQKGRNAQPPFNPSVGSLCHFCATATRFSYRLPIFETSATALCGTTGIYNHGIERKRVAWQNKYPTDDMSCKGSPFTGFCSHHREIDHN